MSTSTIEVTPEQHIALLRHLAGGKTLDVVAAIMKMPRDTVLDVASKHGYPDPGKLSWAADVLAEKQSEAAKADIPAGTPDRVGTTMPDQRTPIPSGPMTKPDEIRILLNTAKSHPSKRIQAAADRVFDQLDRLRGLMREDQEKNSEKRRLEAEKAAARAEVARLEAQLKAAKAKLRGGAKPPTAGDTTPADTDSKTKRNVPKRDITCPDCGANMHTTDAGMRLHRMRAHQDGAA